VAEHFFVTVFNIGGFPTIQLIMGKPVKSKTVKKNQGLNHNILFCW